MFFEELVEQHRVYHFVAHTFHETFIVVINQTRIHFLYFLRDQTKAKRLGWIEFLLQPEADRLQSVERPARRGEWFDVLLVTFGRNNSGMTKPAVAQSYRNVIVNTCAKVLC